MQEDVVRWFIDPTRIRSVVNGSVFALLVLRFCKFLSASRCRAPVNLICGSGTTQRVLVTASSELDASHGVDQTCLDNTAATAYAGSMTTVLHKRARPKMDKLSMFTTYFDVFYRDLCSAQAPGWHVTTTKTSGSRLI